MAAPWGPIGSVAFELAPHLPVSTPVGDFDLVLKQQELPNREEALELLKELANAATPARADVMIETRCGGVKLASLAL